MTRCRPLLDRLGRRAIQLGDVGRGSAAELLFNAQLGVAMAGFADVIRLAAALGLSRDFVLDEVLPAPVSPEHY